MKWFSGVWILLLTNLAFADAKADKKLGKEVYQLCIACHGEQGAGRQELLAPAIAGMDAWYVKRQLLNFRAGGRGKHPLDAGGIKMRPMARTLNNEAEIEAVSDYVGSMKKPALETTFKGSFVKGKASYQTCAACHGAQGQGNQALNAPSLLQSNDWYYLTQLKHFKEKIRGGNPAVDPIGVQMVAMAASLPTEEDMKNVIFYIQSLR